MSDDDGQDLGPFLEALDHAHEAQTRFDTARQLAAKGVDAEPQKERVRFQQLVIAVWKRFRPYLKHKLETYWEEAPLYAGEDGEIQGLKQLHHYQGATRTSADWDGNGEVRETTDAVLLPPTAVRNALDYLTEAAFHLSFLPDADTGRPVGTVDGTTGKEHLTDDTEDDEQDTATARS